MVIPKWICKKIDSSGLAKIEAAVRQGEVRTTGEIVPMVVRSSSMVSHIPILVILLLAFCVMPMTRLFPLNVPFYVWMFVELLASIVVGFFVGRLAWVQRLLISEKDKMTQVHRRALVEFYQNGLNKTSGSTGVLIFLSLMEKRAVVLADETINKKLDPKIWNEVMDKMISKIKTSGLADGISSGVLQCAEILEKHFPSNGSRPDELKNNLQIKD